MDISIFLAQAFGIYFLVISLPFLFNYKNLRPVVNGLVENQSVLMLGSLIALILGIVLILVHNVWVLDWRILITLVAWIIFIKGVVHFYFPAVGQIIIRVFQSKNSYMITGCITFLLGLFFLYHGFFV